MSDAKKIAVLVQERQGEALRMALGLTLADDKVSVFNIGMQPIEANDENNLNVESLKMMDVPLYSVHEADSEFENTVMQVVPEKLLEFDHVVPY
ncbi:MAG: hypothetical protein IBX61_08425 [Thermoleophilia bacterium]|nr:hypothetical protein [Thermoleophilia bacterium]